jgi:hypothetical protein
MKWSSCKPFRLKWILIKLRPDLELNGVVHDAEGGRRDVADVVTIVRVRGYRGDNVTIFKIIILAETCSISSQNCVAKEWLKSPPMNN